VLFLNRNLFPYLAPDGITDFGIGTPHKPNGPYGRLSGDGYDLSPAPGKTHFNVYFNCRRCRIWSTGNAATI